MPAPIEELSHSAGTIAGWVTAFSVAALVAFKAVSKTFFGLRKDARDDRAEEGEHVRNKFADSVYHQLIDSLKVGLSNAQDRINAMDKAIDEISVDFRNERAARMEAEDRAVACERDRQVWNYEKVKMVETIANLTQRVGALERRP